MLDCRLPVGFGLSKAAPPTSLAFANTKFSFDEKNVNRPVDLIEPAYSPGLADNDGFVKPNSKGFINYFKNSSLLGSKKDLKGITSSLDKPTKSPLKWLSSLGSPRKSQTVQLHFIKSATSVDGLNCSSDGNIKFCRADSVQLNGTSSVHCNVGNIGCLRTRKAFSCDDNLSALGDSSHDLDEASSSLESGTNNSSETENHSPSNKEIVVTSEETSSKGGGDDNTKIPLTDNMRCESFHGMTGSRNIQKRFGSKGGSTLQQKDIKTPEKPPRLSLSNTAKSKSPSRHLSSSSSNRLSLPITTPKLRGNTSPKFQRVITPTPRKPPRLSLTGLDSKVSKMECKNTINFFILLLIMFH